MWKAKHTQVVDTLRGLLLGGEWQGVLPGYRTLEELLEVSRPTIEKALSELTAEGLLAEAEVGKSRKILAVPVVQPAQTATRTLLILGSLLVADMSWSLQHLLDSLSSGSREEGWRVTYDDLAPRHSKTPGVYLDRLMKTHRPDRVILLLPGREVATWFLKSGVPFFCCGGVVRSMIGEINGAGSSAGVMAEVAARHLVAEGHRRILYPVAPVHAHLKDELVETAQEWGLGLERAEIDQLMPVRRSIDPEAIHADWRDWLREMKPTAVIAQHHQEVLSLIGFCSEAGIRIPKDLSVVSLTWEPSVKWMNPEITAMEHPDTACAKLAIRWLGLSEKEKPAWRWLEGRLLPGGTVGPPRARSLKAFS